MRTLNHAALLLVLAGCSLLDDHVEDSAGETAQDAIAVLAIPALEAPEIAEFAAALDELESQLPLELEHAPVPELPAEETTLALDGLAVVSACEADRPRVDPHSLPVRLHDADVASLRQLLPVPPCKRPAEVEAAVLVRPVEPFEAGLPFEGWDATLLVHLDGDQAYLGECKALPLRRADQIDHYHCFHLRGRAGDLLRRRFDQWGVHRDGAIHHGEEEIETSTRAGSVELCVDQAVLNRWRSQIATKYETMGLSFPAEGWDLCLDDGRADLAYGF